MGTQSENSLKVPENLMEKFKIQAERIKHESEPEFEGEFGISGSAENLEARHVEALESINDTLSWIVSFGNDMAHQNNLPGTGKVPPEQVADLLTIIAKRNASPEFLQKSPEIAGVTILGGIAVSNYLAYQENKKANRKPEKTNNES